MTLHPLGIPGMTVQDLYEPKALKALFELFISYLQEEDEGLCRRYLDYLKTASLDTKEESSLLLELSPLLSSFIGTLFSVQSQLQQLSLAQVEKLTLLQFRKEFVQKRVLKKWNGKNLPATPLAELEKKICAIIGSVANEEEKEWRVARHLLNALSAENTSESELALFEEYVALRYYGSNRHQWMSLQIPEKLDFDHLVESVISEAEGMAKIEGLKRRRRVGFTLTDQRASDTATMGQVGYCLYCHDRDKDSCSKGLRHNVTKEIQRNPLGTDLQGCPLDEKISESHLLRKLGDIIGALAMITVDNPMCPGTGHRICNDCMKACIFQKQEPVNIPQIETNTLTNVLNLPMGFEIYSLLTRWNPLNRRRPYALPYNGKNILVVGMGPAGYTLTHYLLNEGFGVVGIDGLKIEPLPAKWRRDTSGMIRAVKDFGEIREELDQRVISGFGGVAEYGITNRWDKNFLKVIYLTLARRETCRIYGGVRFGGTIEIDNAWELGFDHIAMATGAGSPTIINMKNNLIRGIRKASDFLMSLQLNGAYKESSLANLQIQLPAVVIGGGLTAIDTATEILAYYPAQVEKILTRYEKLVATFGSDVTLMQASEEDREILQCFLEHGRHVRAERKRAANAGELPNLVSLVRSWGGVSILYRKRMADCPAYRLNHEEVTHALQEGISFIECVDPVEAIEGAYGAVESLTCEKQRMNDDGTWRATGDYVTLSAKSVFVAAGTAPNTVYEKEQKKIFELDGQGRYFQPYYVNEEGSIQKCEGGHKGFLTSYEQSGRRISFYGDNHPHYFGNVVKAMASAKDGYPQIVKLFEQEIAQPFNQDATSRQAAFAEFIQRLDHELNPKIERINRLTPTIVEVVVKAPMAARKFRPGQFFRFQNYESRAPVIENTSLAFEGLALTGAWTDREKGLLGMIVLEMGASSRLCASLKAGEPVVVMGPTGAPTEIPNGETVLLIGGGLGNAVLFSIAKAMKEAGNRILYFAAYRDSGDLFKRDDIEADSDVVVWSSDRGEPIKPGRKGDYTFSGNVVQAMVAYGEGKLGAVSIPLSDVNRVLAIGSDRMMDAVRHARSTVLEPYLKKDHVAIGSINSPMQCMLKQICAQCLQKHVNPHTGEEVLVFSCFNQDQHLDHVDFRHLNERLKSNHLQEVLTDKWLDYLLTMESVITS